MRNFKKLYRNLEMQVMSELRVKIAGSKHISNHTKTNAIRVNIFGFTELTVVNDRLTFLDEYGNDYSLMSDCTLEDLIDILHSKTH